jgi:hypothetical protein
LIDAKTTAEALKRLESNILSTIRQALGQSAALTAQLARTTNKFKDRTGNLRGSIQRIARSDWHQTVRAGGRAAKYAIWIEDGSKAHEILPRRAQFLRFEQNGSVRFAKRVFHPGTKATHFMRTARDAGEINFVQSVEQGIAKAI